LGVIVRDFRTAFSFGLGGTNVETRGNLRPVSHRIGEGVFNESS